MRYGDMTQYGYMDIANLEKVGYNMAKIHTYISINMHTYKYAQAHARARAHTYIYILLEDDPFQLRNTNRDHNIDANVDTTGGRGREKDKK